MARAAIRGQFFIRLTLPGNVILEKARIALIYDLDSYRLLMDSTPGRGEFLEAVLSAAFGSRSQALERGLVLVLGEVYLRVV